MDGLHLLARDHRRRRSPEPNLAGNGASGDRMIACDDDDVNTSGLAGGDGGRDAVSHRILESQQSGETEVTRRLCAGPCPVQRLPGARNDLVTGLGEGRHLIDPTLAINGRQRDKRQHDLRSALGAREDLDRVRHARSQSPACGPR